MMWYEIAAVRWACYIGALLILLSCLGCARLPAGVSMDDDEAKACQQQGCTVWTDDELKGLYLRGVRDGIARARGRL